MEYVTPANLEEACRLSEQAGAKLIAGGTDLCVQMAEHSAAPDLLVDIASLEEIDYIIEDSDSGAIRVGGGVTIADITASELLPACLRQGAKAIGSPQIRNLGTIGGNICNASPCGDTLSPLTVLDAEFILVSSSGERRIPASDFFTGPKSTVLAAGEILKEIVIPSSSREGSSAFATIGKRKGQAISQANTAVRLLMDKGVIREAGIAAGSVAPVPLRLRKTEALLEGKNRVELNRREIAESAAVEIVPIDDVRASKEYRYSVTGSLVWDALNAALAAAERGTS